VSIERHTQKTTRQKHDILQS